MHNLIIWNLIFWIINFFSKFNKLVRICFFKIFFVAQLSSTFKNTICILRIWVRAMEFNFRRIFQWFNLWHSKCSKWWSYYGIIYCHWMLSWFILRFLKLWSLTLLTKSFVDSVNIFHCFWIPNNFTISKINFTNSKI